jgi:acetoacetyl-CoA reductase
MKTKKSVALITGGMGGIGSAICKRLAEDFIVITTYTNADKAKTWLQQQALQHRFHSYACDVTDYANCQAVCQAIIAQFGQVDVLVNNAGITRDASLRKMTKINWDMVINTNLSSLFNMSQPIVENMITQKVSGRIINISSVNGQKGQFGQSNYAAAKAGVHGFTKALALELASKNITVNTISPGYIATEMVMAVDPAIREKIISHIPIGRLGEPEEVAEAVAFLASSRAGFITGSNLAINGGQHMY